MAKDLNRGPIGGSASTAGAKYGATIAAWACVRMLLGARTALPWRLPHAAFIRTLACENDSEVDDLVLEALPRASVYIQIKHGLDAGAAFKSAIGQLSRQFADSKFDRKNDRLVIVTDGSASGTIRVDLPRALSWFHSLPESTPLNKFPHSKEPSQVLGRVLDVFDKEYSGLCGTPTEDVRRQFLKCVELTVLDPMDGNDKQGCIESLTRLIGSEYSALAWAILCDYCLDAGRLRRQVDIATVEAILRSHGLPILETSGSSNIALGASIAKLNRFHLGALAARRQYNAALCVRRHSLDEFFRETEKSDRKVVLVTGGSGQGKTTWCAVQCSTDNDDIRIFIPAECIMETDTHLRGTVTRLLRVQAEDDHQAPFAPAEVKTWLESAPATIFVDGLDRATVNRRALVAWLQATASDADAFAGGIVMTTRPEIVDPVRTALGESVPIAGLGDFSEFEAIEAALKLGIAELARYRHPRLMSFYAQLASTSDVSSLRREQAVARFIDDCARKLASDSELFPETVADALNDLGRVLARSGDGLIEESDRIPFERRHGEAYRALRKGHVLSVIAGVARIEIDDIAEHLAGKHVDIRKEIERWHEIRESPLRIGALRSALEQLAVRDPAETRSFLDLLARDLATAPDHPKLALFCSVVLANDNLEPLLELANLAALYWDRGSIELGWGAGLSLMDMLSSARWPPILRVRLLWPLAQLEDSISWREKEWHPYEREVPVTWNNWRDRFLGSVQAAGRSGLEFLLEWFDSHLALENSNEAQLGHLARGAFFAVATAHLRDAVDLLAKHRRVGMLAILALRYPTHVLEMLGQGLGQLSLLQAASMVEETLHPFPASEDAGLLAAAWLKDSTPGSEERRCLLRILISRGDPTASAELVQFPYLTASDIAPLCRLPLAAFEQAISVLAKRTDVDPRALEALYPPPEFVEPYARMLLAEWAASPPLRFGRIVETVCRVAEQLDEPPASVYGLIDLVLDKGNFDDRQNLAIFATPWNLGRAPSRFVVQVLNEIFRKETSEEMVRCVARRLLDSTFSEAEIETYLARLDKLHPGVFQLEELRMQSFRYLRKMLSSHGLQEQ